MHDVFISYKSEDSAVAVRIRDTLEDAGIPCWIAERDISAGSNYAADIPKAIGSCKVVVLVLTQRAQESPWIMKELDSAIAGGKLIIPVKIGYFDISKTMSFLLTGIQYYDATINPDEILRQVVRRIRTAIDTGEVGTHKKLEKIKTRKNFGCLPFLIAAAVMLGILKYYELFDIAAFLQELPERLPEMAERTEQLLREFFRAVSR